MKHGGFRRNIWLSYSISCFLILSLSPSHAIPPVRPLPQCTFRGVIAEIELHPQYRHKCLSFWGRLFYDCPHVPHLDLPERYEISLGVHEISFHSGPETVFERCEDLHPVGSRQLLFLKRAEVSRPEELVAGTLLSGVVAPPAPDMKWIVSYEVIDPSEMMERVRTRAEECLRLVRNKQWDKAADCFLVEWHDRYGWHQVPLDAPGHPKYEEFRKATLVRLKKLYNNRPPGGVSSVRLMSYDHMSQPYRKPGARVMVSYRHGDLDGFEMAPLHGKWYRVSSY